eukprot:5541953-Pyramimonas_sp.AAC.1
MRRNPLTPSTPTPSGMPSPVSLPVPPFRRIPDATQYRGDNVGFVLPWSPSPSTASSCAPRSP